jgi:DNA-directed RNA polymerase specialized sigma24 family protein
MQEAMIHLWRLESREPGHTLSWYLQSCRFHLANALTAGRSADSTKRQNRLDSFSMHRDDLLEVADHRSVLSDVSAREIVLLLMKALPALDRVILAHLAEGFGCREIARKLRISHPAVIKHRRGIAALAVQFGIAPSPDGQKPGIGQKGRLVASA